ncbi:MAG TPA: hypothetical protein PLI09_08320 [Candidatus Hydrogenedentes bacterium]|nr:hypothetical protein [Candidatus Hydrogenedentota bacterium]
MKHVLAICIACVQAAFLILASVAVAEPVVIGGVTYEVVDEGEPFVEASAPEQSWEAPKPYRAERRAGLMAFQADDPGEYIPKRIPRDAEHVKKLCVFVSQGETTCFSLGVHTLKDINGLSATLDLKGAPVSVELRHMHCWPQRTGWNSRKWVIIPELLLPFTGGKRTIPVKDGILWEEPFDVESGKTVGLWVTVKASAEAVAGRYTGTLSISGCGEKPLKVPIKLEILPIVLQQPQDKHWLIYGDSWRWHNMNEEQIIAELRDFAAHGFNGLVEGPFGNLDLSGILSSAITFDASPYRKVVEQCKAVGMQGPHVCQLGGIPEKVRSALGITCDVGKDVWPEELRRGVTDVARAVLQATKDAGAPWYFYGVDEPTGDNTYAIQEYQCWHDAGVPTYATFYKIDFLDKASAYLTTPCFVSGLVNNESEAQKAREGCKKNGAEFWWYGTGCYVNPAPQESGMIFNRYGAGVFFWKTGAKTQVTWTFCRPHGDVFNDFDGVLENSAEPKEQVTAYPHFLRPNDWSTYQGAIPTVAWESLREGYNDYRYLHALKCAIEQARASADKKQMKKADKAEKIMNDLVADIPWCNPMNRPDKKRQAALTSLKLQQLRRTVADQILILQK